MIDRRSLLALALVAAAGIARADVPRETTFTKSAYDAAIASGQPMLVEISATWCPICKKQKAIMSDLLQDPKFGDLVILNIDFDSQKDLVRAFGAQQQSTLIVYGGGKETGRSVGDTSPKRIQALLASAY